MGQPAESVIDLGELAGDGSSDVADPARTPRGLVLALVAVLVAVGLSADAVPPSLLTVLTTPFAPNSYDVSGDLLYAVDGAYAPNRVVAYRLRDGRQLWQVRSPATGTYLTAWRVGGRTVLAPDACTAAGPLSTVAVDNATGHEVWRRAGVAEARIAGGRLVLLSSPHPTTRCLGSGQASGQTDAGGSGQTDAGGSGQADAGGSGQADAARERWEAVDVATGAVTWSAEVPEFTQLALGAEDEWGPRRAVLVAPGGAVTVRDLTTGAVTGRMVLPELARVDTGTVPDVTLAGDHVLVVRRRGGFSATDPVVIDLAAYDAVTLATRWSVRVSTEVADRTGYTVAGCGPMLCVYGQQWTVVLDPRDGTERWRSPMALLSTTGRWALLNRRAFRDLPPAANLTVRDLRTGESAQVISGLRVLSADLGRAAPAVLGATVDDRTWLAALDRDRVRVLPRGSTPGWYGSCVAEARYLGCSRTDGRVRVWRFVGG